MAKIVIASGKYLFKIVHVFKKPIFEVDPSALLEIKLPKERLDTVSMLRNVKRFLYRVASKDEIEPRSSA